MYISFNKIYIHIYKYTYRNKALCKKYKIKPFYLFFYKSVGVYLFKVESRITKTICNSVFIVNFAESQNKAIAIFITDHTKRF